MGETPEAAARRELREETGLEAEALQELVRYEVRGERPTAFHFRVHMYGGTVRGEPRVGSAGEAVGWMRIEPAAAHPVVLRALNDAGLLGMDPTEVDARCRALGLAMTEVPKAE